MKAQAKKILELEQDGRKLSIIAKLFNNKLSLVSVYEDRLTNDRIMQEKVLA